MSKNTMIYGLLIAGGLLAYYTWRKNSETSSVTSDGALTSSTSGTFVDDVPVTLEGTVGIKAPVKNVIKSLSQIVEPLIGTKAKNTLNGVRPLEPIQEPTFES
jgi:hypothetical protein